LYLYFFAGSVRSAIPMVLGALQARQPGFSRSTLRQVLP
jgi:hypothetical protein